MAHDVFISHSSKDKTAADAVCAALEQAGVRCWIAPRDILPGASWADSILKGIAGSRLMVLVFSRHTQESNHIRREVERAAHHGIAIAPFRIEDVALAGDLEYFLSSSHWMDAIKPPFDQHLIDLSAKVRLLLGMDAATDNRRPAPATPAVHERPQSGLPTPPVSARRPMAVWAAALGVLALVGGALMAGAWWRSRDHGSPPATGAIVAATQPGFSPVAQPSYSGRKTLTNSLGMKFIEIPAGEFMMGSPVTEKDRGPNETQHNVILTRAYMMGVHEVTRGQFAAFVKAEGYKTDAEKGDGAIVWTGESFEKRADGSWKTVGFSNSDDHPVVCVSWNDAAAFCAWLSRQERRKYRLPTEAEWEYAARAGTQSAYIWGDDPDQGNGWANAMDTTTGKQLHSKVTFHWNDGFPFTAPVGSFRPNAFGLHDVVGNVSEWCSDAYENYRAGPAVDPKGRANPAADAPRVLRDGFWNAPPGQCRVAIRYSLSPSTRECSFGFRVCLDME